MSSRFEKCIESLLSQEVICEVSNAENFNYLEKQEHQDEVSEFLHRIGRKVIKTRDQKGYYCVFSSIDSQKKRNAVLRQFEHVIANLEGLIDWVRLVRSIDSDARPIEPGLRIYESEFLAAIEESSSLKVQLESIAKKLKRSPNSNEARTKLRSILQYLVEENFLNSMGSSGSVFIATAKWSLIYDQLEFIRCYDGFEDEVVHEEQQGLF